MENEDPTVGMVLDATLELVRADALVLLMLAAVGAIYGLLWYRGRTMRVDDHRLLVIAIPVLAVVFAAGLGLKGALDQASMVDDAFISFRYARNWVDGLGLVFNAGERVEGYTNFLWVVILAAAMKVTPWDAPEIALVGCLLCFVANLVVVALAGRRLAADSALRPYLPVAVIVLGGHWAFASFATTGMETMLASLLVNLGVLALLGRGGARGAALAGSAWIAAALCRPDHGIFYVAGGGAVLVDAVIGYRRAQRDGAKAPRQLLWSWSKPLLAYAAPFSVYLLYGAWKVQYYGSLIPNTYYAKSADEAYWSQGLVYAATFYLGSHFWIPVAMTIGWLLLRTRRDGTRRLQVFVGLALVLYNVFVAKVGGDFMYGRFYISLLPLALLGAEGLLHALGPRQETGPAAARPAQWRPALLAVLAGLLLASSHGVHLIPEGRVRWHVADEGSVYRLSQRLPVVVDHPVYRLGNFFGDVLAGRGIEPTIAASGIGMMGYYSRLPLIDLRGLTDATISRRDIHGRNRPGHEKWSSREYLIERDVNFIRGKRKAKYRSERRLKLGGHGGHVWLIHTYDPELMALVSRDVPEIQFTDFEAHLDYYIATLDGRSTREVRKDLRFFRSYYFDHVDDGRRERILEDWLATHAQEP